MDRRSFLKGVGAVGIVLASGITIEPAGSDPTADGERFLVTRLDLSPESWMMEANSLDRPGMVFSCDLAANDGLMDVQVGDTLRIQHPGWKEAQRPVNMGDELPWVGGDPLGEDEL